MSISQGYYDQEELWGNPPELYQQEVLEDLKSTIPPDVKTILDVGCGDGFITNHLNLPIQYTGLDISLAALRYVCHPKALGSVTRLPFCDGAFDLVMANDIIEHIPDGDYQQALSELQRISRKYILITVPFMENPQAQLTECTNCGSIFHINHHQRSFGVKELSGLFDDPFTPCAFVFTGRQLNRVEIVQQSIRASMAPSVAWEKATCPHCGARASSTVVDPQFLSPLYDVTWALPDISLIKELPNRNECSVLFEKIPQSKNRIPSGEYQGIHLVTRSREMVGDNVLHPGKLVVEDNRLVYTAEPDPGLEQERAWLEYQIEGIVYRLAQSSPASEYKFLVPLWFLPQNAPYLTTASEYQQDLAISIFSRILNHNALSLRQLSDKTAVHDDLLHSGNQQAKLLEKVVQNIDNNMAELHENLNSDLATIRSNLIASENKYMETREEIGALRLNMDIAKRWKDILEEHLETMFQEYHAVHRRLKLIIIGSIAGFVILTSAIVFLLIR